MIRIEVFPLLRNSSTTNKLRKNVACNLKIVHFVAFDVVVAIVVVVVVAVVIQFEKCFNLFILKFTLLLMVSYFLVL